ncbi:MAG: preprotein translocase subunit YajC [Clostridiales bacterium]|nr:preprotein translocase subunit YajC [Clostridiales bacterium]
MGENGSVFLIIIMILLLGGMFFMQSRNAKKNKKAQEEMRSQVVIGAEVMTIGGIIGKIVAMDNSKNTITVESGTSQIVLTSRAIHSVVTPVAPVVIPEVKEQEAEVVEKTEE